MNKLRIEITYNLETDEYQVDVWKDGILREGAIYQIGDYASKSDALIDAKNYAHDIISDFQMVGETVREGELK